MRHKEMARLQQDIPDNNKDAGDGFSLPKFDPIPDGDYLIVVEKGKDDAIQKVREANGSERYTSMVVYFVFVVLDGPHIGRKVYDQIALIHATASYQMSCLARLKAYFKAAGLPEPSAGDDSDDLHGKSFMIRVTTEKGQAKADKPGEFWPDKNKVVGAFTENPADAAIRAKETPQTTKTTKTTRKPLSFADPVPEMIEGGTEPDYDDDIPF
jgi:hypothetical protein